MTIKALDTVVLTRDVAEHKLKQGDLGAVVEVYPPDGVEVEFVTGSGHTQALLTLQSSDVRPVGPADMLAVRKVNAAQPANNTMQPTIAAVTPFAYTKVAPAEIAADRERYAPFERALDLNIRYQIDPETDAPHLYKHGVSESEVEEVLGRPGEDRPGVDGSRVAIGQTLSGRYLKVIYVPNPRPGSLFVITAYDLTGKALLAYRRRKRRKR